MYTKQNGIPSHRNRNSKSKGLFFGVILGLLLIPMSLAAQVFGDVDSNNAVDIVDSLLTAQYYVGLEPVTFNTDVADVSADNSIDIVDALLIAQYYVGIIDRFPIEDQVTPEPEPKENIALTANVSTSHVSDWENLDAVNDDLIPASSGDTSNPQYGNWPETGTQWVEYQWGISVDVSSAEVYWFDDNGGIDVPSSARLMAWNGSSYQAITSVGTAGDVFNSVSFAPVTSTRIRLEMVSNGEASTGIQEFRVFGKYNGELPTLTPSPEITPTPDPEVTPVYGEGDPYIWPSYSPTLNYDFRDEFPNISMPSNILYDCPQIAGTQSQDWWTFHWGPNANSLVTSAAITPLLQRMNKDFNYFRDIMGWPPDKRAQRGYKSAVYLFGSGLCTDNASNTEKGGWQSSVFYNGESWPMVLLSYYPVYSFDPACRYNDKTSQQSAVVHEGIHSILASMPGVKNAAWFHEGGNTWLQQEAYARQNGNFGSMGFLNGTNALAPFMPIECYSGWLQDGSFGGPSAEGVNMSEGGQQICTWRTYLGGVQYSNAFPTFLGLTLGTGSVAWIWRNCPTRVLEGMAAGLGEEQMKRLIVEYRSKQALLDMGQWSQAFKSLLDSNFGRSIVAEWQPAWLNPTAWIATPYAQTTNNNGLLTPEQRTTPGWTGANQIPLRVSGSVVSVNFQPIGENMVCQLAYRATDGSAVYSQPVTSGDCVLRLDKTPYNNVVIAVITNTTYIYKGEATRKAHYDYRLQLGQGISGTADIHTRWYDTPGLRASFDSQINPLMTKNVTDYAEDSIENSFNSIDFDISQYCSQSLNQYKPAE